MHAHQVTFTPLRSKYFRCNVCGERLKKKALRGHSNSHDKGSNRQVPIMSVRPFLQPTGLKTAFINQKTHAAGCPWCHKHIPDIYFPAKVMCLNCFHEFRTVEPT